MELDRLMHEKEGDGLTILGVRAQEHPSLVSANSLF
jgi:hypothetical protein